MKESTIIWADMIESDYDAVDSKNIIENIYKIMDLEINNEDIKLDEKNIYNKAKDSEHKNMIFV